MEGNSYVYDFCSFECRSLGRDPSGRQESREEGSFCLRSFSLCGSIRVRFLGRGDLELVQDNPDDLGAGEVGRWRNMVTLGQKAGNMEF